jgi:hypothetical protein
MSLNLRTISGGTPLTQSQLDGNFTFLYGRDITGSTVTGTTLFLYKQDGTVLTTQLPSNSGGTSTTFTGNTSASCISNLYVSNIYGCSPITIHDSIKSVGSSATGITSFAFGSITQALGDYSHAEGAATSAVGIASHAEGDSTNAVGAGSHAEGLSTIATGNWSHAEGDSAQAIGTYSHAEGSSTQAIGDGSHAEGSNTYSGAYAYLVSGTSGNDIVLNPSYGDVTPEFTSTTVFVYNSSGVQGEVLNFSATSYDSITSATTVVVNNIGLITPVFILPNPSETGNYNPLNADQILGTYSHAEGENTTSIGGGSHAEGGGTQSIGQYSHAEGYLVYATGDWSHAEGTGTQSIGVYSHAEGESTTSSGTGSHAEGIGTVASGGWSHAEGIDAQAIGSGSHAEGRTTQALGDYSHAEGDSAQAIGIYSHAEGYGTQTIGNYSHAEGSLTYSGAYAYLVSGTSGSNIVLNPSYGNVTSEFTSTMVFVYNYNGTQGEVLNFSSTSYDSITSATTVVVTVIGSVTPYLILPNPNETGTYNPLNANQILGNYSHAEGDTTQAIGIYSHAEGGYTQAIGVYSHVEGLGSQAIGQYSHAEGISTQAIGQYSHAEGQNTIASGTSSHSQGILTRSNGNYSFASGSASTASGIASFIHSSNSTVSGNRSVVLGGQGISGTSSDFVYVSNLNINNQPTLHTGTTSQVLVRNTTTGNVEVKNIGNVYHCALFINSTSQPNAGVIPSVPVSNGGIADKGRFITGFTQIVSNGTVSTASGVGNYVTSPPSCSFGSFNNNTGVFTITQAGLYLVEGAMHLKPDTSSSVYWQSGTTSGTSSGTFGLGICDNTITNIYGGNYMTVQPNLHTEIDISTSNLIYADGTNDYVSLKYLNWTNRNYDGTVYPNSDGIRFSITKVY